MGRKSFSTRASSWDPWTPPANSTAPRPPTSKLLSVSQSTQGADQPASRPRRGASSSTSRESYSIRRSEASRDSINDSSEQKLPPRPTKQRRTPSNPNNAGRTTSAAPAAKSKPKLFEVRAILDSKTDPDGRTEYLVAWAGFPSSENSWESAESLKQAPQALADFRRRHPAPPVPAVEPTHLLPSSPPSPRPCLRSAVLPTASVTQAVSVALAASAAIVPEEPPPAPDSAHSILFSLNNIPPSTPSPPRFPTPSTT